MIFRIFIRPGVHEDDFFKVFLHDLGVDDGSNYVFMKIKYESKSMKYPLPAMYHPQGQLYERPLEGISVYITATVGHEDLVQILNAKFGTMMQRYAVPNPEQQF